MKKIYLILSYSGTVPALFIKMFTRYKYSHVSISLDKSMNKMYSFGRKEVNNPLNGGLVIEDKDGLFYQRFNETECIIYELEISMKKYKKLKKILENYEKNIDLYFYDIIGLILRIFKIRIPRKCHYVCTDFVSKLLGDSNIYNFNKRVITPKNFLEIPNKTLIYKGKLLNY